MVAALTYTRLFRFFIVSLLSFHYFISFFVSCNTFLTITSLPSYRFLWLFPDTYVSLLLQFTFRFILLYLQPFSGICFSVPLHSTLLLLFGIFFLYNPTFFSLVSSDTAFQFHLLLLSTCYCFFSRLSSFSSSYLNLFATLMWFWPASSLTCGNKMPTRCNRGFYFRSYCLLNMFRASLCPSPGAQGYCTVVAACGISCCGFQVAGLVWSW